ncbi:MAG: hypothetical protein R2941_15605 [Desulfobacterales bacterium]
MVSKENRYKLLWDIEKFFQWWKKHVRVYHLAARSECGGMVHLLSGLIAYLLMAVCCRKRYGESVSAVRLRQFRTAMQNELGNPFPAPELFCIFLLSKNGEGFHAKT